MTRPVSTYNRVMPGDCNKSACVCMISEELRQLLAHNELQIRAIQTLWEQHLQEALKDWEQQYANITQVFNS